MILSILYDLNKTGQNYTDLYDTGTRDLILIHFQGFSSSQFQGDNPPPI